jgi:hypothetical protein
MKAEDETLSKALGQWKVDQALPPRFQEGVWRRIERAGPAPTAWEIWRGWVEEVFARRTATMACVTVLLLAGLTAGYTNGHAYQTRWKAQQAAHYVQSLDPYAQR